MPRESRQAITQRPQESSQQGAPQVRARASATAIDATPHYLPQVQDPDLKGLVEGLSMFNPTLQKMAQDATNQQYEAGRRDRAGDQGKQSGNSAYEEGYFHMDGLVKGQQDGASLLTAYNTEFDKDTGNLDEFISKRVGDNVGGLKKDTPFMQGYDKSFLPAIDAVRKAHLEYQKKAIETNVESNAMKLLDGGVRAYITQNQPLPDTYISSIKDYVGKNLGVSTQRFDQLLFESVRRLGDEGHYEAYEVLKRDHPDGTPGLYNNPEYRPKIDAAANHSFTVAEQRAKRDREEKQETALYDVFDDLYSGNTEQAKAKFNGYVKGGLFSRASDLIKWQNEFGKAQQKEARADQQVTETEMLTGVYTGKVGLHDVLKADLTPTQKKGLLSEIRRVQHENRLAANEEAKADKAIFKSPEFKAGMDYIKGTLVTQPNALDPFGIGTQFDRQQRAVAELEFTQRAQQAKSPVELNSIREEIVDRVLKRRKGLNDSDKGLPYAGLIRFTTPQEASQAARQGLLGADELQLHLNFFKAQRAPKANAR